MSVESAGASHRQLPVESSSLDRHADIRRSATNVLDPLFRQQALDAKSSSRFPVVLKVRAPTLNVLSLSAAVVGVLVVVFCSFGRVTQLISAPGVLVPIRSSIRIFVPHAGVLAKVFVSQGQLVKTGDPLMLVTGESFDDEGLPVLLRTSEHIRDQLKQLRAMENSNRDMEDVSLSRLRFQISSAEDELKTIDKSERIDNQRLDVDTEILSRAQGLRSDNIVRIMEVEQAEKQVLSDRNQILSLYETRSQLQRELSNLQTLLVQSPIESDLKIAALREQELSAQIQLEKNEEERQNIVVSPVDGTVALSTAYAGEQVTSGQSIMSVNPRDSELMAQLLVPTTGIGFIKAGSSVELQYEAFPYQTFGYYHGHVKDIASVTADQTDQALLRTENVIRGPAFSVLVTIDQQSVETYGKNTKLVAGDTLKGFVSGETRYVWQWMLNPVLSVSGKSFDGFTSGK